MQKTLKYPALIAYIATDGEMHRHLLRVNLIVTVIDKLRDDEQNLLDLESDTLQIVADIYGELNTKIDNQIIAIAEGGRLQKIADKMKDRVVGWQIEIPLRLNYKHTQCNDIFVYPPIQCPDATVRNSDNSYSASVASGGTLVLPDEQTVVYVDGLLVWSGLSVPLNNTVITINL
ncbi:MAG: hypothetical protein ABIK73_08085 [candidate division WOR-3 bacterium]